MKRAKIRMEMRAASGIPIGAVAIWFLALALLTIPKGAEGELLSPGAKAPDIVLLPVDHGEARSSLGVPGKGIFRLRDIKAKAIIINVYGLYCPPCHREAPRLNRLHGLIAAAGLTQELKLVGLAAGNSVTEVMQYQQKHSVPFPLFQDPNYAGHKALGAPPVPSFYVIVLKKNAQPRIVFSQTGEILDEEVFLQTVLDSAGLAPKK